jgi:hypothetical protein
MSKTGHAVRGGEVGMNGESYKGGQFLPCTTGPKRHLKTRRTTGRQLVSPGVWEVSPNGERAIFAMLDGTVNVLPGGKLEAHSSYAESLGDAVSGYLAKIQAYNMGQRWQ